MKNEKGKMKKAEPESEDSDVVTTWPKHRGNATIRQQKRGTTHNGCPPFFIFHF
jgi:hypothetical protein